MSIWAISDLHLPFSKPEKTMTVFPGWENYTEKIQTAWLERIGKEDLVLIPGDISWAMKPQDALLDLDWIDRLPGQKLLLRGNHDYWWTSLTKLRGLLPPSIQCIHNSAFLWNDVAIGGARLWDTPEYSFEDVIEFVENPLEKKGKHDVDDEKIFSRELERLKLSLEKLDKEAKLRIAMTHYPPIGKDLLPSRASAVLESFKIDVCVFGHLHNVKKNSLAFGKRNNVDYIFASCDYLSFAPVKIFH